MSFLKLILHAFIWPGDRFCAATGQDPKEDAGMLRGFINNIVWGAVVLVILVLVI